MSNNEKQVTAQIRTRMEQEAEKLMSEAEKINEMVYPKSRRTRALELKKKLGEVELICGAISKEGKICTKPPVEGAKRCPQHGGLATGPKTEEGKQRALANLDPRAHFIHGLYAHFIMSAEEKALYDTMMNHYIEVADLDPANIMMLDRALRNFILNQRKERAEAEEIVDETDSYNDYDSKFMRYMQALGLDRKFNQSNTHKDNSQGGIAMLFMDSEE